MGDLDVAAKVLLQLEPEALLRLGLPHLRVQSARASEVELPVMARRMDKFLEVFVEGEPEPYLVNVEAVANWSVQVPRQAFEYWSLARIAVGHDRIATVVFVFKPGDRQGEPRNYFSAEALGTRTDFVFGLECLWTRTAEELLAGPTGLLPFVPYAAGATVERVDEAIAALHRPPSSSHRGDLVGALAVFAINAFPQVAWLGKIPKETLMESTFVRDIKALGERNVLTRWMTQRLGATTAQALAKRLDRCSSELLERVTALMADEQDSMTLLRELERLLPE